VTENMRNLKVHYYLAKINVVFLDSKTYGIKDHVLKVTLSYVL